MNPYEYIIGGQVPDETQVQALAGKLRGSDDRAMLAMLSGDKVLSNVGQNMMTKNQANSKGLAKTRASIVDREQQKTLAEATLTSQEEYRKLMMEQNQINRDSNNNYRREGLDMRADAAVAAKEKSDSAIILAAENKEIDRVEKFQTELKTEGVLDLEAAMSEVDYLTEGYTSAGKGNQVDVKGDIPGMGMTGWGVPNMLLTGEGAQIKSAMAGVANRILKARSGAAVTTPEMKRLANELQNSFGSSDEKTMTAYMALKRHTNAIREAMKQGFTATSIDDLKRLDTDAFESYGGGLGGESAAFETREVP